MNRRFSSGFRGLLAASLALCLCGVTRAEAKKAAAQSPDPQGEPAAPAQPNPPTEATPAPAPAAAAPAIGYADHLRQLDRSVRSLKDQVQRTSDRLKLLKDRAMGGAVGSTRAVIRHRNETGAFQLVKAVYTLDGVQIFSKADDSGRLSESRDLDIYNGPIQPGSHTLAVELKYLGQGNGVVSSIKGSNVNVGSSQTFVVPDGHATSVTVIGQEKGGLLVNPDSKPQLDFRVTSLSVDSAPAEMKPAPIETKPAEAKDESKK